MEVTVGQRPPEYRRISHPSKEARRRRKRSGGRYENLGFYILQYTDSEG